jgi:hypothetical protein
MKRCDFCELPIGEGCACALPRDYIGSCGTGTPFSTVRLHPAGDAILISLRGVAHRLGCSHHSESDVKAPVWGWVNYPDPQLWRRISENSPLRATGGNTKRAATRRCRNCDR